MYYYTCARATPKAQLCAWTQKLMRLGPHSMCASRTTSSPRSWTSEISLAFTNCIQNINPRSLCIWRLKATSVVALVALETLRPQTLWEHLTYWRHTMRLEREGFCTSAPTRYLVR